MRGRGEGGGGGGLVLFPVSSVAARDKGRNLNGYCAP